MKLLHNVRLHSRVCVGHALLIQSQTSREDKDEKTQENYSAPWCYHPPAELEVRDRTVLKMLGKEERPFTTLYTGSKLSISMCPRHCSLLKWLFFLNVSSVNFAVKRPHRNKTHQLSWILISHRVEERNIFLGKQKQVESTHGAVCNVSWLSARRPFWTSSRKLQKKWGWSHLSVPCGGTLVPLWKLSVPLVWWWMGR